MHSESDHVLSFREAMESHGISFKGDLVADGKIHRVRADGDRKGSLNAWYLLHLDGRPAGAFGCWKRFGREKIRWVADKGASRMSPEERRELRERIKADQAHKAAEEEAAYERAAARAQRIWNGAESALKHGYLMRKSIHPHGTRVGNWEIERDPDPETGEIFDPLIIPNALLVPIRRRKELVSLQAIFPDDKNPIRRGKDFLKGGRKHGCFYTIGDGPLEYGPQKRKVFIFCEGFATGASIFEATEHMVVVCFDCGNLMPVVEQFREKFPQAILLCAADNDHWTVEPVRNPGVTAARKVADKFGGLLAIPVFKNTSKRPTDYNDLGQLESADTVKMQIMDAIEGRNHGQHVVDEIAQAEAVVAEANSPNDMDNPDGVPARFRLTDTAVQVLEQGEKYDFVCGRVEVLAMTRDENGGSWGRYIRFRDPDGNTKEFAIPYGLLAGDGLELRSQLGELGLHISSKRARRNDLIDYISSCHPKARMQCVTRVGWSGNGKSFALPGADLHGPDSERVILQSPIANVSAYRQAGSIDEWKSEVARYAVGNSRLAFSISAAFAAPLLDLLGDESGGFHWCGGSSIGKSTALVVAGSVWGGGDKGYLKSWKATDNGLEALAAAHCDTVMCIDEMSQVSDDVAYQAAYTLANGTGKHRADRNGGGRPSASWRVLFLSSGEVSLTAKIEENGRGKRAAAGQQIRIINLEADAGRGLGIFENLHGFENGDKFATHLKAACNKLYGTAAPVFLRSLIDDRAGAIARLGEARNAWLAKHVPPGSDGQVQRAARRFGLVAAAGEEAARMGITPWPAGEADRAAATCFRAWLGERGGTGDAESKTAVAQVREFFEAHGASRFAEIVTGDRADAAEDGSLEYEKTINRAGWRRRMVGGDWVYYVLPETWKKEVCKGLNLKTANRALIEAGILMPPRDQKSTKDGVASQTINIPGHGKPRVYVVCARVFDREEDHPLGAGPAGHRDMKPLDRLSRLAA